MSEIEKVQGFMRARDVREALKGKVEPDVSRIIETLAEAVHQHDRQIAVLANMVDKVIDSLAGVMTVATAMKEQVNKFKAERKDESDLGGGGLTQ